VRRIPRIVSPRRIPEKKSQISAMNERLRESNFLMKDLQRRVALPPGLEADLLNRRIVAPG
jgi:hypothetical protein